MTVILINCVTLGMYQPCEDTSICDQKCKLLKVRGKSHFWFILKLIVQIIDDVIYVYFVAEMLIKMVRYLESYDINFMRINYSRLHWELLGRDVISRRLGTSSIASLLYLGM